MKKASYCTLKALLVLNIFKSLSLLFVHIEIQLSWKDKTNFKLYEVITKKKITIYYVNILRDKSNQTKKLSELIDHKMRKYFLEKSYEKSTKCVGESKPRPFPRN